MKRGERDEDTIKPPHGKRAAVGPREGESCESVHSGGGALGAGDREQHLTSDGRWRYLESVKEGLKNYRGKYEKFLQLMGDFKTQKVDRANVIIRVKELLKGHRNLILGFNMYLSRGYEIMLLPKVEDKKPSVEELNHAWSYVAKVKVRFLIEEHVYKSFLEIINMYKKGKKTIEEVYQEVAMLFKDHTDLLDYFTYFLHD